MFNGKVKSAGGDQPQIAGSSSRNTYKPPVSFGPGKQAAPQHFSRAGYEGQTGGKAPVARPEKYSIVGNTNPTKVSDDARVHFQFKHHEVAHNDTEKEGLKPQEQIPEYRQKFDIASGTRSD